jgi:hypothetical protein
VTDAAGSQTTGFGAASKNLQNNGDNTCWFSQSGTPSGVSISYAYSPLYSVVAGNKYEASAYLGVVNTGNTYVFIRFYQSDGTTITGTSSGNFCTTASSGGTSLSGYCRSGVVDTAPSLTTLARVFILTAHNGSGATPAVYFVHSYFGEATSDQTGLTPWGPAGLTEIVGGMIKTGTITAANIAASTITANELASNSVTAGKINVTTLAAINANMGSITAGSMNIGSGAFTLAGNGDTHISVLDVDVLQPDDITVQDDLVVISSGSINFSPLGGGGDQFVCVDNGGNLYASPTVCN